MDCIFFFFFFWSSQQPCKVAPSQKRQVIVSGWSAIKVRAHKSSDVFPVRDLLCLSAALLVVMLPSGPWDPRTELLGRGQGGAVLLRRIPL